MSRRFLFIFLPFFSAEILSSQKKFPSHRPILVSHNKFGTELVYSMNRSAANSGIFPSMPITDALSIQSNCLILEKSMLREQFLEQMLIKELRKFSPWISKKTNNSFILNITGCSHLFNGEKQMAKKISLALKIIGLSSSIGIGDSPSSAMAAAIFVDSHSMILEQNNNILIETYINHEARASRFKSAIKPKSEKYSERTFAYQILDQKAESFISKLPVELLNLDSKELDEIEKQTSSLIKLIFNSKEFQSLIKNPTINQEDILTVVLKISEQYKLNNLLTKFLKFLVSKRRFFYVEKILKDFIETCSKKRGEVKAEISSAKELSESEINNIKDELSKNFSSKIKLNYNFDPDLIGGLVIQVGSTMVDTSIKNKLKQIENRMIEA